jgi:hypothetical protein
MHYYANRIAPVSLYNEYLGENVLFEKICTIHIVENNTHSNSVYYQIQDDDDDDDDLDGHVVIDTDWVGTSCVDDTNVGFSVVSCAQFISEEGTFIVKLADKNARFVFDNGTVVDDLDLISMETWETEDSCVIDLEYHSAECCQKWMVKIPVSQFGHSFSGKLFIDWNAIVFDVNHVQGEGAYYGRTLNACVTVDVDGVCKDGGESYNIENAITGTIYLYNSPDFSIVQRSSSLGIDSENDRAKRTDEDVTVAIHYEDCDYAYAKIKPNLNDKECSKYEMVVLNAYYSDPNDPNAHPFYVYQKNAPVFNDDFNSVFVWKQNACFGNLTWQIKAPSFCSRNNNNGGPYRTSGSETPPQSWTIDEKTAEHLRINGDDDDDKKRSVDDDDDDHGGDDCVVKFTVEWRMDPKFKRPPTTVGGKKRTALKYEDVHDGHQVIQTDNVYINIVCNAHQYWDEDKHVCVYKWYTSFFPRLRDGHSTTWGSIALVILIIILVVVFFCFAWWFLGCAFTDRSSKKQQQHDSLVYRKKSKRVDAHDQSVSFMSSVWAWFHTTKQHDRDIVV